MDRKEQVKEIAYLCAVETAQVVQAAPFPMDPRGMWPAFGDWEAFGELIQDPTREEEDLFCAHFVGTICDIVGVN